MRFFFGPLHKKEEQEGSVLAQRYRSWLLRKALFMGFWGIYRNRALGIFSVKLRWGQ
ncbi:hypothetical protein [Flagellimonas sp.]|uniref:hypothetical protein n=1 Tax=Flagellimonas sp. TaxID=2058762 RepID=UPI003BACB021